MFRLFICIILFLPARLIFAGQGTGAQQFPQEFEMRITLNDRYIGFSKVKIVPKTKEKEVSIYMEMKFTILFIDVHVKRFSKFNLLYTGGLTRFYCDSNINFPGYKFKRYALSDGQKVIMRTVRGRDEQKHVYHMKKDFDYMTGSMRSDYLGPKNKRARVRFLDLDSGDLCHTDITLHKHYTKTIGGREEQIYEIVSRSSIITQKATIIARNDVPIQLDVEVPIVGWMRSRMIKMNGVNVNF